MNSGLQLCHKMCCVMFINLKVMCLSLLGKSRGRHYYHFQLDQSRSQMQWKLKKSKSFIDIIYQNNNFGKFTGGKLKAVSRENPCPIAQGLCIFQSG